MIVMAWIFGALNIMLGLISIVPCLMGAAMGMDSPQSQKDIAALIICWLFLTFPVVSFVSGVAAVALSYSKFSVLSLIFCFLPWVEAISVLLYMYLNEAK
jgi:hypothetical protein